MEINQITERIIGCAIEVHRALGPGLLESAYEECLAYELRLTGLQIERQKPTPVVYKEIKLEYGYRIDILVNGLLINFNVLLLKNGIKRYRERKTRRLED